MHRTPGHASILCLDPLSPEDITTVLADARSLQLIARSGQSHSLLRGKKLGLLCEADNELDAILFRGAALEMGAHVAHVRPSLSALSTPQEVQDTARMLGRLYDAVECQGMAPALVRQMGIDAGVPVYDGIASSDHPTARLGEQIEGDASSAEKRRLVLQAVLLDTLA